KSDLGIPCPRKICQSSASPLSKPPALPGPKPISPVLTPVPKNPVSIPELTPKTPLVPVSKAALAASKAAFAAPMPTPPNRRGSSIGVSSRGEAPSQHQYLNDTGSGSRSRHASHGGG